MSRWPGPQPRLLPFEQWPRADLTAWHQALQDAGPFGSNSAASAWSEDTLQNITLGYARWLAWLLEHGEDLEQSPADRVTPPRVAAYLADLRLINSDFTVLMRLRRLRCNAAHRPGQGLGMVASRARQPGSPLRPGSQQGCSN
jgi:hypothetical protein